MAINLVDKFAKKVDERFRLESLTDSGVNKDFEWKGAEAISILTLSSVPLGDYDRTATSANRYGTRTELQDTKQVMTITKDRGNSISVDKGNYIQQNELKTAGRILAMQTAEVVVPEVDEYRLETMDTAARANEHAFGGSATTKDNAYERFLALTGALSDDRVPNRHRVAFVTPAYKNFIKLDSSFTKNADLAYKSLVNGQIGEIDGVKVIEVPSVLMPTSTDVVLAHKSVTVAAEQLNDFQVHNKVPGLSGMQVDYRIIYDAFVRDPKVDGIAVNSTAAITTTTTTTEA